MGFHRFRLAMITGLIIASCFVIRPPALVAQPAPASGFVELLRSAEAKTSEKQWNEAAALWQKVVEANPVEVRYWKLLADVRLAAKNYADAIPAYEKVIALRGGFPASSAYNIACCYALLGKKELALEWLNKALDMGFRSVSHVQADKDLQSLHDDPRFRELVGLVDTSKMTREEGWQYDLKILAREVKRKGYAPFRKISEREFDEAIKNLSTSISSRTDAQIIADLMKLSARLGDGHTAVALGPQSPRELLDTIPLKFYLFKEGLFVVAADEKYKDLLGAQVLRFEKRTVEEVVAALDPLINRDASDIWVRERAPYLMRSLPLLNALGLITSSGKVELTVKGRDNKTTTVSVAADLTQPNIWNVQPKPPRWTSLPEQVAGPLPLYLKNASSNYWFEYLPNERLVYFQYNVIYNDRQESLASFSKRLFEFISTHDVDRLVIDMRWNNGGNTLLNEALLKDLISCSKCTGRGKLFIIIGRRVFSAAQNAVASFQRYTDAIFVGEPTGSSPNFVGDEVFLTLPYSKTLFNASDVYWQHSWPWDFRTWIAPQIYIEPTFEAYRMNRDPVMETILSYK